MIIPFRNNLVDDRLSDRKSPIDNSIIIARGSSADVCTSFQGQPRSNSLIEKTDNYTKGQWIRWILPYEIISRYQLFSSMWLKTDLHYASSASAPGHVTLSREVNNYLSHS
jgi:hypothetical protein